MEGFDGTAMRQTENSVEGRSCQGIKTPGARCKTVKRSCSREEVVSRPLDYLQQEFVG